MSALTLVVTAFMLGFVAMAFAFTGGAVIVAVPLALLVIAGTAAMDFKRRRAQVNSLANLHAQSQTRKVEFTDRSRETLYTDGPGQQ